jgi:signal transduction histidine kinase
VIGGRFPNRPSAKRERPDDEPGQALTATVANGLQGETRAFPLVRRRAAAQAGSSLATLESVLTGRFGTLPGASEILSDARSRALRTYRSAGADEAADRLSASVYAGDALAGLAVERLLNPGDAYAVASELTGAAGEENPDSVLFELFLRAVDHRMLAELPPLFAVETQLHLLVLFGLVEEASLWLRTRPGRVECVVHIGDDDPSRRTRAVAKLTLAGAYSPALTLRARIQALPVLRWGRTDAALVTRVSPQARRAVQGYIAETAAGLTSLLERAILLERSAEREHVLVQSVERRLTRLGFDLHDGPIQDVIAIAGDILALRTELYPFVAESHRESAYQRFEEFADRLRELDDELRGLALSLESSSVVSRPIEEVLHREMDTFRDRTGIPAQLRIDGDCSFLGGSQRIALFRAMQEGLSNAREHSGATSVDVRLRARRGWTELNVTDNGCGFRVEDGLARAAKRGRLGLVGIGERVRMLGGTFEIESEPGGPTRLVVRLPRWEPLYPTSENT